MMYASILYVEIPASEMSAIGLSTFTINRMLEKNCKRTLHQIASKYNPHLNSVTKHKHV